MDRVYVIRHKWHHEGLSLRQIARGLGVSRNTVREGYRVGITTVRAYLAEKRRQHREVHLPLVW